MSKYHNVGEESQGKTCLATLGVTADGKVFPVRCKKWSCPVCAPINALRRAIEVANGVQALQAAGVMLSFVTVTQPASVATASYAYSILDSQWDGFRNRWQYWAGKHNRRLAWYYSSLFRAFIPELYTDTVPRVYAAFVEGQSRRAGMPHFHFLASPLPGKETLRQWAVQSGLGYQVDLQPVLPGSGVAWYVSKYSTKSSDAASMPRFFRRVRLSQDFPRMVFRTDLSEQQAVVRQPRETLVVWSRRARLTFGLDPAEVLNQALILLETARGPEVEALTWQAEVQSLWEMCAPSVPVA